MLYISFTQLAPSAPEKCLRCHMGKFDFLKFRQTPVTSQGLKRGFKGPTLNGCNPENLPALKLQLFTGCFNLLHRPNREAMEGTLTGQIQISCRRAVRSGYSDP